MKKNIIIFFAVLLFLFLVSFYFIMTQNEHAKIDKWIYQNNLNQFGDTKDTGYVGGNPLFSEGRDTGSYRDRFDYIEKHHLDKPWDR